LPDRRVLPERARIPLTVPAIDEDDLRAVAEVLRSGFLVQGARVAEFEAALASYIGARHAVAVTNCTAALQLALMALGVERGDRVAVTTYSWPATANVIVLCGAEPVFVDIDSGTYNMDPDHLDAALRRTKVKAVLPVHTFGGMADMRAILDVCERHGGIPVIEDAACALGADLDGRQAGTWGVMGCFSFHPRKSITTGEGGLIVTDDAAHARTLRMLRNHGLDPAAPSPDFVAAGFNVRMTEFQAAMGVTQLQKLDRITEARRTAAARYDAALAGTGLTPPRTERGARHVYQSYVALLPAAARADRADLIASMKADGIETTVGTYHMPLTTFYRQRGSFKPGDFPATDDVAARALTLPLYDGIAARDQTEVVEALTARVPSPHAAPAARKH
jgi:perosamine synthetase